MGLLSLQEAEQLVGVEGTGRGQRLERVRGGLLDAGLAALYLRHRSEAGERNLGGLDHVEADRTAFPDLHVVAPEDADRRIDAARLQLLLYDNVWIDCKGHGKNSFLDLYEIECACVLACGIIRRPTRQTSVKPLLPAGDLAEKLVDRRFERGA